MNLTRRKVQIISTCAVLMPLFFSACFSVYVAQDVNNPRSHLRKAQREIDRIQQKHPKRNSRAHSIHILVYVEDSGNIVRVSAPLWFVNSCLGLGMGIARRHGDFDIAELENKYDFEWKALRDLGKIGPGLLVEVVSEDDQVLVWLK